jgi:polar amino acid transport system permease protein/polar amino acid transport system substrate-binding protein
MLSISPLDRTKMKHPLARSAVLLLISAALHAAAATDALQRLQSGGILKWGADAEGGAPYVFPDPQQPDHLIGFEVEIADALARKLGVRARMVQNQWDGLVPALQRGDFDIALNGLEITDEHRRQIALSQPYYVYSQQIITRKDNPSLTNLLALKGHVVGTLSGTVAQRLMERTVGIDVRVYPGQVEPFRDLNNGRLDAVMLDLPIAVYYLTKEPNLKRSGDPFAPGFYGIGVRQEDTALLLALNQAIAELRADGTLEKICRKWGLWDKSQLLITDYHEAKPAAQTNTSTFRNWRLYLPMLLRGAVVTVEISVLAMALAIVSGLALALLRLYGIAPLRWAAAAYTEVIRGTPLLIQLYLIYYGLPNVGIRFNAFVAAVLGLGLNYAAYEAENYRAGIQAVPREQMEAALSLGMPRWLALRAVVLPQAVRVVIPPVTNDFIALFKDSSLVSVITMVELTKVYGMLALTTYDFMGLGLVTAAIYFGLSYPVSLIARHLERKLQHDRR